MTVEQQAGQLRYNIAQQIEGDLTGNSDPVGEALLTGYLSQVDEAVARVVTPQKTNALLLHIKIAAARQAVVKSYLSVDDTLTNLVVHRDLLARSGVVPQVTPRRQSRTSLRLTVGAQLATAPIALLQLLTDSAGSLSDVAINLAMTVSCLLAALMLCRSAVGRPVVGRNY
ncbi:hypothetical protein AB0H69_43250 [Streptomyces phaeochromogenes]|uniref:hypothetical protein n=1 Tax=Streptomyces phaeochromogenes TaxID=1923 RepID=UPI0033C505A3